VYSGGNGGSGGAAFGGALEVAAGQTGATNCTFAGSSAAGGAGGAGGAASGGYQAGNPGASGSAGGGNLATVPGGTLALLNCIVANSPSGGNASGSLVDAGHNLSSDATCHFTAPGSRNSIDPMLGVLGNYGGPTETIPLLVTTDDQGCQGCNGLLVRSPAIDAGEAIPGLVTDQRGVLRPQGAAVDIGAFECMAVVGQVRQYDGTPFANVTIWMLSTFSPPLKTVTDAQGRYQIVVLPDWGLNLGVYWVQPEAAGAIFTPPYTEVQLGPPTTSSTHLDFTEPLASGQVRQADGSPFANVAVLLISGSSPLVTALTDAQGRYQLVVAPGMTLNPGVYQAVAQAGGAVFSPASIAVPLGTPRTRTGVDFTECVALGQVRQCDGSTPFTNVTVSLVSGSSPVLTTVTDPQGRYQLAVLPGMTLSPSVYRVVPAAGAAVFSPAFVEVQLGPSTATRTNLDFLEAVAVGQVRQSDGGPFTNVTIWLQSKFSPPLKTRTDAQGRYQIVVLPGVNLSPGKYSVVPEAGTTVFSPLYATLQIPSPAAGRTHLDFASPLLGGFTAQRGFRFTGWAGSGQQFRVEVAPAMPAPFWQPLGTVTSGIDGHFEFTDPNAWYFPIRFYRLVPQGP
jgi:5-hydroxyisourate hydrolase-like protein (transthyretin family)